MRQITTLIATAMLLAACTSIDCPLNNTVYAKIKLAGQVTTLADTLTISTTRTAGSDTVLINRALNIDSLSIPLSYQHERDIFYIDIRPQGASRTIDTIAIDKVNSPHFESVDCPASMFHSLQSVSTTRHRIDSVVINNPQVTYDASKAHLLIYLKSSGN